MVGALGRHQDETNVDSVEVFMGAETERMDKLRAGQAEYRRKLAAGEIEPPKRTMPAASVLMRSIREMCVHCMGGEKEPGVRAEIARCSAPACPLFPHRPYQGVSRETEVAG